MPYQHLLVERQDDVAVVTLNRPQKLNALSQDLMQEIIKVAEEFREDYESRVVVFAGAGKHFSAGADLTDPKRKERASRNLLTRLRDSHIGPRMLRVLLDIPQITIAAVHGAALGGGACIAAALDFRVGSTDCRIGFPESGLGMSLSWVSLPLAVHLVGPARAKRWVILASRENAETLLNWGFLDEVVPREQLMDRAMAMAKEFAAMPPIPAQMIKRSVNAIATVMDQAIMHMDMDQLALTTSSRDYREGVTAFLEKRKPNFIGD